jgi:hypothetical protein
MYVGMHTWKNKYADAVPEHDRHEVLFLKAR